MDESITYLVYRNLILSFWRFKPCKISSWRLRMCIRKKKRKYIFRTGSASTACAQNIVYMLFILGKLYITNCLNCSMSKYIKGSSQICYLSLLNNLNVFGCKSFWCFCYCSHYLTKRYILWNAFLSQFLKVGFTTWIIHSKYIQYQMYFITHSVWPIK